MTTDHAGAITSLDQIEALSNPLRIRILRNAGDPITVAELAERLDVPLTRLYYHVNLLIEHGMLVQVDQRKSGARIERIYRRTANDFRLGAGLIEKIDDPAEAARAAVAVLIDPARAECEDFLAEAFAGRVGTGTFGRTVVRLTDEQVQGFSERLESLFEEMRAVSRTDSPRSFSCTVAFVPIEMG
jgi:DNA-binding transcriptional ArsR family regulator